ncbi:GGDEF domain-containing protein [Mesorhizobium sp. CAU 1741]|uniref:GGDEF domain-containing protein n=1 Tax=Mesorhizobium sp. CAU 1741 TaxID=3140366 RepID=UPI00325C2524
MSGAAFILGINLLIAGLFCATFVLIATYGRHRSAWWIAGAYACGVLYLGLEAVLPVLVDARLMFFLGATTFLAALLLLNIGLAHHYRRETPRTVLVGTLAVSMVAFTLTVDMPRDSMSRMFLYQTPYAAMQAIGALIVFAAPRRRLPDNALGAFMLLSALHFLSKPLLATLLGGPGATSQDYLQTDYAMLSQALGVVLSVATALLLLVMLIASVLKDITAKSETDLLSGLLNRRGFEDRLADIARHRTANGMPVTLIMCDLDHFKSVNDTFGHAVGDRLIALFATTLRESAARHHVLGRIGGEEFAIVLPGSNLAAGRLFAENARTAYAGAQVDGLGALNSFTASFGVAEMEADEPPSVFAARADSALYEAKRSGRDCVRVSRLQDVRERTFAASR